MPQDKPSIPRETQYHPAQDFYFLRTKGIEYIQELAGKNWTDYNEHDPGVTILEQLAFAITELGYKTNLDIKDLIASQEHLKTEGKNTSAFFTAFNILTTNPITVNDLRKLVIDRIKEVDSVWITLFDPNHPEAGIEGSYIVVIKINKESSNDAGSKSRIKREIKDLLYQHRNLGELCREVIILQEQEVYMKADIELLQNSDVEKVHAKVIFELEKYILSPVRFYTLNEMMSIASDTCDVFDGPQLYNGFIRDSDLKSKRSILYSNELISIIRNVEGVKSVKHFKILHEQTDADGNAFYNDYFDQLANHTVNDALIIAKDKVAVLGSKIIDDENNAGFFNYYRDNTKMSIYQRDLERYYKELISTTVFRSRKYFDNVKDLPVPQGTQRNIKEYYSIQNHFPNAYGLSKDGIPSHFSEKRQSYVYQLKGYLLLFEQLLSDYLMQLARFDELFSLDEQLVQTYFTQVPWNIPHIYKLLSGMDNQADTKKIKENFDEAVNTLIKTIDDFFDRRSRFMDHLYARLGDSDDVLFEEFRYYKNPEDHKTEQLNNKIRTLKNYPLLTREKSRSFNPLVSYWGKKNYSIIEQRVRIKLGIDHEAHKIAHQLQPNVNFGVTTAPQDLKGLLAMYPNLNASLITLSLIGIAKHKEWINTDAPELIENIAVDEPLFRRGIWEDNLSILAPNDHTTRFLLLFKTNFTAETVSNTSSLNFSEILNALVKNYTGKEFKLLLYDNTRSRFLIEFENNLSRRSVKIKYAWRVLEEYNSEADAFKAAFSLRNKLIRLNKTSEGFYLLDHALLQPREPENKYMILFNNEADTLAFQLATAVSYKDIHSFIVQSVATLRKSELKVTRNKDKFRIAAYSGGAELGHSLHTFDNASSAKEEIQKIKDYFLQFTDLDIQNEKKVSINHSKLHPELQKEDYNFTVSVFLSGWTARFFDLEFRYQTEILFRKYTPAHIAIQFHWLELPAMLAFEHLFDTWLTCYKKTDQFYDVSSSFSELDMTHELNLASRNMLDFIKGKYLIKSMTDWENFQKVNQEQ